MRSLAEIFRRNSDGSWTCVEHATFEGPAGRMQVSPGTTFAPGTLFMNVDLAKWLDEEMRGQHRKQG
jgi:hypothetical protein